ncbi:hypothetical protein DNTS_004008 [Danionella cerebrum]|uniref:Insulin-like growth factor-binding protein 3 n=1 Tax=Danionella cerebrum TaxID=2873325 RepID=A0A553Q2V4_9TELE|nr:hypothetical protein DNTS_004008 [Danionella translucida]
MTGPCALCLTALLAAFARLAQSVSPVVRCEPCDDGAMVMCKPLPWDCAEPVKEPGCGCCMTCPLSEEQACGVYTGRCGSGLSCLPRPGETKPLQALLEGRGMCAKTKHTKQTGSPKDVPDYPEDKEKEDIFNGTRSPLEVIQYTTAVSSDSQGVISMPVETNNPVMHPSKQDVIQKGQIKKSHIFKVKTISNGVHTENYNFSLESKRETEYGPCRREMESLIKKFKISNVVHPRGFRIPNCDQKGFYKKKQCRPSKGRKRGHCWCVDKYGQPLPGYDGKEKVHCYNMETK